MKHGLWLEGDRLSFLGLIFHLPVLSWHEWYIWNGNLGKQFLFSRTSPALLRGFRHNDGGGGEAEKYLRLPSAPGMSGGASWQENTPPLTQWGRITSIMPQHVRQRATVEYRTIESWNFWFFFSCDPHPPLYWMFHCKYTEFCENPKANHNWLFTEAEGRLVSVRESCCLCVRLIIADLKHFF